MITNLEVHRGSPDFFAVMHDLAELDIKEEKKDHLSTTSPEVETFDSRVKNQTQLSSLNKIPLRKCCSAPNSPQLRRKVRAMTPTKSPLTIRRSLNVDDGKLNKTSRSPLTRRRNTSKPQAEPEGMQSKSSSSKSRHTIPKQDEESHQQQDYRSVFPSVVQSITHEDIVNAKSKQNYQPDWAVVEKRVAHGS